MAKYPNQYPCNIWLLQTEEEFQEFLFTGGKVVYIVEEPDPRFETHPSIVSAGVLLPPCECIAAELDGRLEEAEFMYLDYLSKEEADPFVTIIIGAALKQIPIGIMFGRDEREMKFPMMFMNYLCNKYGLIVGVKDKVVPCLLTAMLPGVLSRLYLMNIIDYPVFMERYPAEYTLVGDPSIISKMAVEVNPVVKTKDFQNYYEYFEKARQIIDNSGRFLVDPMVSI